jgi:type IV secretory pathway TraG/TraD family ATPase VirD4
MGEAGSPVSVVSLAGRRAGLEFVENSSPNAMVALLERAEHEHASPTFARRSYSTHRGTPTSQRRATPRPSGDDVRCGRGLLSFRVDDDAEMIHVFAITWIG